MTSVVWSAFGLAIGAAVLHGALGLRRPIDRTYLSFAYIMLFLAAYFWFEWGYYRSQSPTEAVEAVRYQVAAAHGFLGCILVFIPAYTQARTPWPVMAVYWVGLITLFVANLVMPYGVWFAGEPTLITSTFRGEPFTTVLAPPMGLPQYVHAVYVFGVSVFALQCSLRLFRHGARRRGAVLAVSLVIVIACHLVDLFRDAVGGTWPYVAEFGLVAWGLIMSLQLASDYRTSQQRLDDTLGRVERDRARLSAIVDTTLHVRDKLNTPLQTLELGLALRSPRAPGDIETLAALRRAVVELTAFGQAVELTAHPERPR
jgi:hypothetical protein